MLFHPTPLEEARLEYIQRTYPEALEITITPTENNSSSVTLHGWLSPCDRGSSVINKKPCPVIIYFGGNAEEVSWMLGEASEKLLDQASLIQGHTNYLKGYSLALVNYRGYGLSTGKPGEKTMYSDAISVYTYIVSRGDIDQEQVVIMGRSIGTGVAVHLASYMESIQSPARGVVLVSPYDSLVRVAGHLYKYLPVGLLMKHRFEAIELAPKIRSPLLAILAENDKIIPLENSRKLIAAWGGETTEELIKGHGHNDSHYSNEYRESIKDFLTHIRAE